MKRSQLLIVIVAALAVAAVALVASGGSDDDGESSGGGSGQVAPEGAVRIPFAYSPEKEKLLTPLIRQFNEEIERYCQKFGVSIDAPPDMPETT